MNLFTQIAYSKISNHIQLALVKNIIAVMILGIMIYHRFAKEVHSEVLKVHVDGD